MPQAILTKYHSATNTKPSRYSATCEAGRIIQSAQDELYIDGNHIAACEALKRKLSADNAKRYGTNPKHDVWSRPTIAGGLPDGTVAHVFMEGK